MKEYTQDLIEDMYSKKSRHKAFEFVPYTAQMSSLVDDILDGQNWKKKTKTIAKRLHLSEIEKQEKLGNFQTLKRGALVQLLVEIDSQKKIIFTKVDVDFYLDEKNLKKKSGLPLKKRTQKTAIISIATDGTVESINISDSNETISDYWWKEFLETRELSSSEQNTINAFNSIDKVLKTNLQKDFKLDYWTLRDATLLYFRTSENFVLDGMFESIFDNYAPDNPAVDVDKLKDQIITSASRTKGGFDTQFDITQSSIKAKMIKKKITLSSNLELGINGDLADIRNLISTGESTNGEKFIQIYSEKGYEEFKRYSDNSES